MTLLIKLAARPDLRQIERMPRGPDRKAAVYAQLAATATATQKPFTDLAEQFTLSGALRGYQTLVSPNMLVLDPIGDWKKPQLVKAFSIPGVSAIYDGYGDRLWAAGGVSDARTGAGASGGGSGLDVFSRQPASRVRPAELPYGLELIGAPAAWKLGATGKGLVYGSIDTGVDAGHEALSQAYRGLQPDGSLDHDYNWVDFAKGGSGVPADGNGHGTHTTGTAVGAGVGVAPEAKFIAAAGLSGDAGVRIRALQWMLAPTKRDFTAPDPTKAPDVVGMSWWTGPSSQDLFRESIQNLNSAGIEVVKSAGNKGPGPETISSPGQFREAHAIAAVDHEGQIAEFSSRGPSPLPHTGIGPDWKPDFSAPGVNTLSSLPGNKYAKFSGTSMAQPHFAGALLAILSKYPQLTHDQLVKVIAGSARDAGARGRDLEFGHGIVNLPAALGAAELATARPAA